MNVLILGDGPEERSWAAALRDHDEIRLRAAFPGFADEPDLPRPRDVEDALALPGIDTVIVGGDPEFRAEALRRVAAEGMVAVALHPPGPDSEAYYQVSMSRNETGALIVPALPLRLHPAIERLRAAITGTEQGAFRLLRYEAVVAPGTGDLTRWHFARAVDVVRALLGEIQAVTATGDPPGERPDLLLVVQLRGDEARRAEVRLSVGPPEPPRLSVVSAEGTLTLEFSDDDAAYSRWIRRSGTATLEVEDLPRFDGHSELLRVLEAARRGVRVHPSLGDGTRAMEVSEGAARSLRRGRTVELHYEEISELGTFKSVMTSIGCMILLSILVVLPIALGGTALGLPIFLYLAYLIPPLLIGFLLFQLLRFAARDSRGENNASRPNDPSSPAPAA